MSKHIMLGGLVAVVLASLVGVAFASPAHADYYPYPATLSCWGSSSSVMSGQQVTFTAQYSGYSSYPYRVPTWSAPNGYPSTGNGTTFSTTFWNYGSTQQTYTVTVSDGVQTASCSVTVYPVQPTWTPVPPYPTYTPYPPYPGSLQCSPSQTWSSYGQDVTLSAWGGNGTYTWSAPEGNPNAGSGSSFTTRFYNTSGSTRTYTVTVSTYDSYYGTRSSNCTVNVQSYTGYTPTPTPYYGYGTVGLSITGRNITRGQSSQYSSVSGSPGDTIDLFLHVQAHGYLTGVWATDFLPAGLSYVQGSTTLNGYVAADGVTSTGLNIGSLSDGQEAVIKFSVIVQGASIPSMGAVTVYDNAQARADSAGTVSSQMTVTLGSQLAISQVSAVKTGPADSLIYALALAALATGAYALYTRSALFNRRAAFAEIGRLSRNTDLDFSK